MSDVKSRATLWRARRWWRSVSPSAQPTPSALAGHVRARIAALDDAWEERCTETSELVTGFVDDLDTLDLGPPKGERFLSIAQKLRWRELRALLISHVATEVVARVRREAEPLLDELERVQPSDHSRALSVGDLPAFDRMSAELYPDDLVPAVYQALVDAIDRREPGPVDSLIAIHGLPGVDGELQSLLKADRSTTGSRLERSLSLRPNGVPRVVLDLVGVEPMIELMMQHEAVDLGGVDPDGD